MLHAPHSISKEKYAQFEKQTRGIPIIPRPLARFGDVRLLKGIYFSSSVSNAFASWKSAVLNPSVNQSCTGASRS
jgi:hypothetical protein